MWPYIFWGMFCFPLGLKYELSFDHLLSLFPDFLVFLVWHVWNFLTLESCVQKKSLAFLLIFVNILWGRRNDFITWFDILEMVELISLVLWKHIKLISITFKNFQKLLLKYISVPKKKVIFKNNNQAPHNFSSQIKPSLQKYFSQHFFFIFDKK